MKFLVKSKLLTFSLLCSLSTSVLADNVTETLKNKIAGLNAFTSDFTQQVFDSDNVEIQSATGSTQLKQPNLFKWHTQEPDESILQCDGETIWFYDPFIEQVTAVWLKEALLNNPILLLLKVEDEIWQGYQVSQLDDNRFKIRVKDEKSLVESIEVTFVKGSSAVDKLVVSDRQGQNSHYQFSQFKMAPQLTRQQFTFSLPEGVELDDQRQ
ncbi:outer membrane lipoprotein carrier protein LolA [Saccharobesus litoralis]|uniref:Outer-membrane lipoprotein carrier protein n=1 Tax=Saccharobesus litoralis TaxID=2172099 RepID=A0A2S0VV95_9ALTE|nr:outer membrane lipoprotein chaperone LolA [Saccharobesus litoralis]AWB68128.1 outer membrane lipoprotein carrier protein LolA [Saccharobesus litoralis]